MLSAQERTLEHNRHRISPCIRKFLLCIELFLSYIWAVLSLWLPFMTLIKCLRKRYYKEVIHAGVEAIIAYIILQVALGIIALGSSICLVCFTIHVFMLSKSRKSDPLELFYLKTNPRKFTRAISNGLRNQNVPSSKVLRFLSLLVSCASLFETMFNISRNALRINVTAISCYTAYLPVTVRTRATTVVTHHMKTVAMERVLGKQKGAIVIDISPDDWKKEQSSFAFHEVQSSMIRVKTDSEKSCYHWNEVNYETRSFVEQSEARLTDGILRFSTPGEYTNALGEASGCLLDTGDCVLIRQASDGGSALTLLASTGTQVCPPLTAAQVSNIVLWTWQHSTDTVYGILEGRAGPFVDRDAWEVDIVVLIAIILAKMYIYGVYGLDEHRPSGNGENSADLAMLNLAIIAGAYTVRQAYLRPWVQLRGRRVLAEMCCEALPEAGRGRLSSALRTVREEECAAPRGRDIPARFLRDTHHLLFLNDEWGMDFRGNQESVV